MTSADQPRRGQTRELAEFVSALPATQIPEAARLRARQAITDVIGVALAGRRHPVGATMLSYVEEQGGRPVSGVLGGGRTTPELASLAGGTCAHALEFDDTNHPLYGHPSCSIVPAVMALGEAVDASFGAVLDAYVIGVQVDSVLGAVMMMEHSDRGFHSTGTIGTVGATAAAARVLGLDVDATQRALGIGASRAAGLRVNIGTMTKPLHAGAAAMAAVQSARLSALGWDAHSEALESPIGFCSAFLGPRSGREINFVAGLGQRWALLEPHGLAIKPYPSCGATHAAIEAALLVRSESGATSIDCVRVGVSARAPKLLAFDRPATGNEGRFSAHYTVAAALVRGKVTLEDFTDEAVADPVVTDLMARVEMVVDDRHRDGTQYPASVQVTMRDGRVVERTVELARGKNANPLSEDELCAKFAACAGPGGAQLWRELRYADADSPVGELVAATQGPGR